MKLLSAFIIPFLLFSCSKKKALINEVWAGQNPISIVDELDLPDSVFVRPAPFNDSLPWISKGEFFLMDFHDDNTVKFVQVIDTLVPNGYQYPDSSPRFYKKQGLYEFPLYKWRYNKKSKRLTVFIDEKKEVYTVTKLHGQIFGGSGPRLGLNDTLNFDTEYCCIEGL